MNAAAKRRRKGQEGNEGGQVITVSIEAVVHPTDTLFMSTYAGKAKVNGEEWELLTGGWGGNGTPILRAPDGRYISFSWEAVIAASERARREAK